MARLGRTPDTSRLSSAPTWASAGGVPHHAAATSRRQSCHDVSLGGRGVYAEEPRVRHRDARCPLVARGVGAEKDALVVRVPYDARGRSLRVLPGVPGRPSRGVSTTAPHCRRRQGDEVPAVTTGPAVQGATRRVPWSGALEVTPAAVRERRQSLTRRRTSRGRHGQGIGSRPRHRREDGPRRATVQVEREVIQPAHRPELRARPPRRPDPHRRERAGRHPRWRRMTSPWPSAPATSSPVTASPANQVISDRRVERAPNWSAGPGTPARRATSALTAVARA